MNFDMICCDELKRFWFKHCCSCDNQFWIQFLNPELSDDTFDVYSFSYCPFCGQELQIGDDPPDMV